MQLAAAPLHALWATPLGVHRWEDAEASNPVLARALGALAALQGGGATGFHASDDDLLQRIALPEFHALVRWIVDRLRDTVAAANQGAWPEAAPALRIALRGVWFQSSNRGRHHDVHTHGNCSWSGVYVVQVDPAERRQAHPVLRAANGITRFYGPHFQQLGGAHADFGNAYLQAAHADVAPQAGQLVVFPSWLAHQALPYDGEADRIIVSFNASVHAPEGDGRGQRYAAT